MSQSDPAKIIQETISRVRKLAADVEGSPDIQEMARVAAENTASLATALEQLLILLEMTPGSPVHRLS